MGQMFSTENVEIFDTGIAIIAGLMIIPAVFADMSMGGFVGILIFLLVLCASLTSSIALTESAVSTFQDELGWGRKNRH